MNDGLDSMVEKMEAVFDKAILTLSGGALGLSLTFYHDIAGKHSVEVNLLRTAWIAWLISIIFVLISFFTSILALRFARKKPAPKSFLAMTLLFFNRVTICLSPLAAAAFVWGVFQAIRFANMNIPQ